MNRMKAFFKGRLFLAAFPVLLFCVFLFVFAVLTDGQILSSRNLTNIYEQAFVVALAAIAVAFIYTTGNIDISIGSIICLAGVLGGKIYSLTDSIALCLLITGFSAFCMLSINGAISAILGIKPMVCAIIVKTLYSAISMEVMGAATLNLPFSVIKPIQDSPFRLILLIGYFSAAVVIFHFSKVGRKMRFLGGNEKCARTVGIKPKRVVLSGYIMAGVGIGLAAICMLIRGGTVNTIEPATGTDVMLATVLGGMSIFGGHRSNCYAGVIGTLVMVLMSKGLLMIGVDNEIIQGIRGILFLLIVYLTSEKLQTIPSRMDF